MTERLDLALSEAFKMAGGRLEGGRYRLSGRLDLSDRTDITDSARPADETTVQLGLLLGVVPGEVFSTSTLKLDRTGVETFHGGTYGGGLFLEGMPDLALMDGDLRVDGNLGLSKNPKFTGFKGEALVRGWADLSQNPLLERLPKPFVVGGKVYLNGCEALETLNRLQCGGLNIGGCPQIGLSALKGCVIRGDLEVIGCPLLARVSYDEIHRVCTVQGRIWK